MTLLLLEALGAGLLFIGIIWWTMFSGRKNGELTTTAPQESAPPGIAEGDKRLQPPTAAESSEKNSRKPS
jgi:cytoskeletal protein RodZ